MARKTRKSSSRAFRVILAATLIVVLAAAAVKFFAGPYLVRVFLERAMSTVWDGAVRLEDADVDFSGMVRLYGLELTDANRRRWVRIGLAKVKTGGWWTGRPALRKAELIGVDCDLHFEKGSCKLPLSSAPAGRPGRVPIEAIVARRVTVRVMEAGRPATAAEYKGIEIHLTRDGESYRFSLGRRVAAAGERWTVAGTYNPQSRVVSASALLDHVVDVTEGSAWLRLLGPTGLAAVQGKLKASGTVRGSIDELAACEHSVSLKVEDARLDAPNGIMAEGISFALEASNGKGRISSASLRAPPGQLKLKEVALAYTLDGKEISTEAPNGVVTLLRSVLKAARSMGHSCHAARFN